MDKTIEIFLTIVREAFPSRAAVHTEMLALRQQVAVLKRDKAPAIASDDRSPFLGHPVSPMAWLA